MNPQLYKRRKTRTVYVGNIGIGGNQPIRIQSMCTSDTKNTESVVNEIQTLVEAGCEIVRVTVPTKADADNLPNIRKALKEKQIHIPLVADIHFTPSIAMQVVEHVDKVRINPGNFADKKLFKTFEITDENYQKELDRIEEKFTPLVLKCKEYGVAMRIGTNHGSLSDRIMNRYGDTPEGMVESALEFLRIAQKNNFYDIVLSMKASNPQVMVTAYRLLVEKMNLENMDYPLHLGVTEAGEGEDARVKSAIGIGTLLEEGIGDTIRVSLTEDAVHEIPVARMLAMPYNLKFATEQFQNKSVPQHFEFLFNQKTPLTHERRPSLKQDFSQLSWGGSDVVRVWTSLNHQNLDDLISAQNDSMTFEGVELSQEEASEELIQNIHSKNIATSLISDNAAFLFETPLTTKKVFVIRDRKGFANVNQLVTKSQRDKSHLELCFQVNNLFYDKNFKNILKHIKDLMKDEKFSHYSFSLLSQNASHDYRVLTKYLDELEINQPIHLRYWQTDKPTLPDASTQLGSLFIDGLGDSLQIDAELSSKDNLNLCYSILQASRVRISKTEFIACPSCGRTQFHLQDVTQKIKARTSHLKGVKIAVMGCIVNGPGEMADADFGYVGTGAGKISLYVGKECVEKNIPEAHALDKLEELIKTRGMWVEQS